MTLLWCVAFNISCGASKIVQVEIFKVCAVKFVCGDLGLPHAESGDLKELMLCPLTDSLSQVKSKLVNLHYLFHCLWGEWGQLGLGRGTGRAGRGRAGQS